MKNYVCQKCYVGIWDDKKTRVVQCDRCRDLTMCKYVKKPDTQKRQELTEEYEGIHGYYGDGWT